MQTRYARLGLCAALALLIAASSSAWTASAKTTGTLVGFVFPKSAANEKISGRLVTDPQDYKDAPGLQVTEVPLDLPPDSNGKVSLSGVVVNAGDGRNQDADGAVTLQTPASPKPVHLTIKKLGTPLIERVLVPLITAAVLPKRKPGDSSSPPVCPPGGFNVIHAPVGGDANITRISIDDMPARVLAERPGAVYYNVPSDLAGGSHLVTLKEGGRTLRFQLFTPTLRVSADKLQLKQDDSTAFHVQVGLDMPSYLWRPGVASDLVNLKNLEAIAPGEENTSPQLPGEMLVLIEDASPQIVSMNNATGNRIAYPLYSDSFLNGPNIFNGSLKANVAGSFTLNVSLFPFFADIVAASASTIVQGKGNTTLTHPDTKTTTSVDHKTGQTTVHDPKTGTTITVDPKKHTTTAKDKNGKSTTAPHNDPKGGNSSHGGDNGTPKIDVKTDVKQNPDGTTTTTSTVTVTVNGQTTTVTVTTTTDGQGGHTTTATDPNDPNSSTSSTVDKNGDVTKTGTSTTNPDGSKTTTSTDAKTGATTTTNPNGSYTATPNSNGTVTINWNTPSGSGGSVTVAGGAENVTPNTPSATNPLPYNYTPPPPPPPPK